jgi:hypothetical protein
VPLAGCHDASCRAAAASCPLDYPLPVVCGRLRYSNTGFSVDKLLKIDEPLGTIYLSHEPHPIKDADKALSETTKADEIVIETAKTGKVTAVVAAMNIFS